MIKKANAITSVEYQVALNQKCEERIDGTTPADNYYFVHILFLLMGLMHFLPFTFFVTANAYWMYKFRNVSASTLDASSRTSLQTHFASGTVITDTVPMLICILASTSFGHKIRARRRILTSLVVLTVCFVTGCGFVKINTDSWQAGFFGLTMSILSFISGANSVMEVGILVILSKFPHYYMKVYLLGQGFAGLFNSILQVLSLLIGTATTTSAMIYFVTGTSFMALTLILFYLSKYNKLYRYHVESVAEDTKRPDLFLKTMATEACGMSKQWTDKYFVPIITFLYADMASLLGRVAASKLKKVINGYLLSFIMLLRMVVFVPLIYFCNAQPRNHLPVLLPHDWQYIIVLGLFCFSNGYFINVIFLDIGKLVEPEKVEDAFMVLMSFMAVFGALISPISLFSVDVL
ncbi:hypothetical protein NQ318_007596 [Aromia moschata]|uniref:Equilibrative nucleoside transporter 3 n=1 Tax=Aromia moschata TaxID=1265417 RepID=A0AAV8YBD4_9CUCU|nr:hypothetical protein NQ318_007596 [Aromia moschata]